MHVNELYGWICESLHLPKNAFTALQRYIDASNSSSTELCDTEACHLVDYILTTYNWLV